MTTAGVTIRIATVLCAALLSAATAGAQTAPQSIFTPDAAAVFDPARDARAPLLALEPETDGADRDDDGTGQDPFDWRAERRACEGCPRRSVGRALLQTTLINVVYETANLIRGQVTARITPKTWWTTCRKAGSGTSTTSRSTRLAIRTRATTTSHRDAPTA